MSFTGGKLRLKGDDGILKKKKKKKKKRRKAETETETETDVLGGVRKEEKEEDERLASTSGYFIKDEGPVDRRTKVSKLTFARTKRDRCRNPPPTPFQSNVLFSPDE